MGMIYKRGEIYWIKYYRNGKPMRESSGSEKESDARRLLKLKEGDIAKGVPMTPKVGRVTVEEILKGVVTDYRVNSKNSLPEVEGRIEKHLLPYFFNRRAANVTTADIQDYVDKRQEAGAANATINRELATLKRGFSLAVRGGTLISKPYIPMLKEDNVRQGFFEPEQLEAVLRHLNEDLKPIVVFAYITGWRTISEILPLEWRQVDFGAGMVRLEPGTTKNKEGRLFPMNQELREVLESQKAKTDALQRETGAIIPFVFHRRGVPIKDFRGAWVRACQRAGIPGRILHDFRRTAVRNLERASVSRSAAMKLTGHKTEAVYRRYAIVSEGDLKEAVMKLEAVTGTIWAQFAQNRVQSRNLENLKEAVSGVKIVS
jgi:integrase